MKTTFFLALSLALLLAQGQSKLIAKASTPDDDAKLFVFGILTEGLNVTWDQTFLDYVNSSNLNTSILDRSLTTLSQFALNDTTKRPITTAALNDVKFTLSNFIQSVFPAGPFGNYTNIYFDLKAQEQIYNDPDLYVQAAQRLLASGFDVEASYQDVIFILKNTSCTPDASYAWSRINNYIMVAEKSILEGETSRFKSAKGLLGFLVDSVHTNQESGERKCIFKSMLNYLYSLFF